MVVDCRALFVGVCCLCVVDVLLVFDAVRCRCSLFVAAVVVRCLWFVEVVVCCCY